MIILEILGYILFWFIMIAGIIIIPFGIPGTFLIVANVFVFGWLTDFTEITGGFIGILLTIAIAVEIIEFLLGAATAGKFGASRKGMFGAILGGFLGAIWATPLLPLIGTLIGAFVGAFAGAALLEYLGSSDLKKSLRAGFGAFLGAVGGKFTKIAAAVAMAVMVGFRLI
ncbi:MAG: DUF456 family protein [bacterium]